MKPLHDPTPTLSHPNLDARNTSQFFDLLSLSGCHLQCKLPHDVGGGAFDAQQHSQRRQKFGLKLGDQLVPVGLKISR